MMARPRVSQPDGLMGVPSLRAPPPRTASNRIPDAWLTTTATLAPSGSTAHRLVAYQGMRRGPHWWIRPPGRPPPPAAGPAPGARLLRHHAQAGTFEHLHRRRIGDEVRSVLRVAGAGQPPVGETAQGVGYRRRRGVEYLEQRVVVHWPTIPERAGDR